MCYFIVKNIIYMCIYFELILFIIYKCLFFFSSIYYNEFFSCFIEYDRRCDIVISKCWGDSCMVVVYILVF